MRLGDATTDRADISVIDPGRLAGRAGPSPCPAPPNPSASLSRRPTAPPGWSLEALGRVAQARPCQRRIDRKHRGRRQSQAPVDAGRRHAACWCRGSSRHPCPAKPRATPQRAAGGVEHGGEIVVADPSSLVDREDHRAEGQRPVGFEPAGARHTQLPRRRRHRARRLSRLGAVQAGQRDARHLRDGLPLDFQSTVRAISSRIELGESLAEDRYLRVDHDNSGVASAAVFDPSGTYLFVALETSAAGRRGRSVTAGREIFRFDVRPRAAGPGRLGRRHAAVRQQLHGPHGRRLRPVAPARPANRTCRRWPRCHRRGRRKAARPGAQGQAVLLRRARSRAWQESLPQLRQLPRRRRRTTAASGTSPASAKACARPSRCAAAPAAAAACTGAATSTRLQDFEGQIRGLPAAQGLMSDERLRPATSDPLGAPKAGPQRRPGCAGGLRRLAGHASTPSPHRNADGSLTAAASRGRQDRVRRSADCADLPRRRRTSAAAGDALHDIGTLKPSSGSRLGGTLTGIDTPTLRDAWATGPVPARRLGRHRVRGDRRAHVIGGLARRRGPRASLSAYVMQMGSEDTSSTSLG